MRTLWIMAVLLVGVEGNLWQFGKMMNYVMGQSVVYKYFYYGCYCGWGGIGQPRDATDRCCFVHDCCYGKVTGCDPKTDSYTYSKENGDVVCGGDDPCKKQICECDRVAATCFRDNKDTYDMKYWLYGAKNCQEESEPC
uniref:Acidic phospholipase A2 BITP01A n=1 Tax=Bothrops insularis TaxID=8723 RepID=PA2A_BOTIN|nr:RecName: Full=Acidic phospholipase A2 BITP01A; Short=svPLA2; AltName: Full=BinTX-I; AltName: Full=Phosphatidylcholine 2-acylhydrolase; Flags: Precursor [Bothrops insularis]AAM09694.1 phospholipase A2 precursor [Bothrops insularis]